MRRLTATALDLAVIAGWAAFAAVIGVTARVLGLDFTSPRVADAFAFVTLVAPATLTFAGQESSTRQATFGKRRMGLEVVDLAGRRLTRRRSVLRSAVKFLPWQLAHTAVFGLIADPGARGLVALSITAQVVVVVSVVVMSLDQQHRALHDWVAGTRVVVEGSAVKHSAGAARQPYPGHRARGPTCQPLGPRAVAPAPPPPTRCSARRAGEPQ